MAYQVGLPAALARRGLRVETVPGWETRSAGSFAPKGALCHWTAGPRNSVTRPSLNIVVNGRADLTGPLCNVYGARDGTAVVVAAGRANHAGAGNWRGLTANSQLFGTEMEAADESDFTPAQRWAYPRINAAYCDLGGFGADMVAGHSEYALPAGRKQDINGYPMVDLRAQVAAILNGEDDMPLTPDDVSAIWRYAPIAGAANVADRLIGVDQKTDAGYVSAAVVGRPVGEDGDPMWKVLQEVQSALANLKAGGGSVDLDALADKVADKLASRLGNG